MGVYSAPPNLQLDLRPKLWVGEMEGERKETGEKGIGEEGMTVGRMDGRGGRRAGGGEWGREGEESRPSIISKSRRLCYGSSFNCDFFKILRARKTGITTTDSASIRLLLRTRWTRLQLVQIVRIWELISPASVISWRWSLCTPSRKNCLSLCYKYRKHRHDE